MVERCIKSFAGQYDELVVIDSKTKSLAEKQNIGMRKAKGDYLIVSNDDVEANKGVLRHLCKKDQVLSPLVNGGVFKKFHGHMFCLPRDVYAEVGGFDETCPGVYHIDSDMWLRLKRAGYEPEISEEIDVWHRHPASTIRLLDDKEKDINTTRQWFINKWGESACGEVGA